MVISETDYANGGAHGGGSYAQIDRLLTWRCDRGEFNGRDYETVNVHIYIAQSRDIYGHNSM